MSRHHVTKLFIVEGAIAWWKDRAKIISMYVFFLLVAWLYGFFFRKWSFVDSIYFSVVTVHTVGYGDLTVKHDSHYACIFGAVYVFAGVAILGTLAGEVIVGCIERYEDEMTFYTQQQYWRWHLIFGVVEVLSCLVIGTLGFAHLEDQEYSVSLYWAVVTASTVGFGDVVPETETGKLFAVVYIPVSIALLGSGVASFASIPMARRKAELLGRLTRNKFSRRDFEQLSHGAEIRRLNLSQDDDFITKNEFVLFLLLKLGKVGEEDLTQCQAIFDNLDRTDDGMLTSEDLSLLKAGRLNELSPKVQAKTQCK